ncbi:Hypothetical protein PHPALM_9517 [Phytophthora palmivora]|uniref:Transmembrane protein 198 n=1 Tax=Phytophthora palmivora TaxID=4796 RepID=A0A2P4Y730_9STRA|nr:Hypothetical protein PHPALM_9517 [Phytophthora palmivora]
MLVSAADSASDTVESLFDSAKGIKVGGSILAIAAIAVGAVMVVMGYRLFRATLFAIGFVAGGVGVALVVEHVFDDKSWVITASWIAFVIGGLIVGSIVVSLYSLGIFIAGAVAGVALAMMIHNSVGYEIYPSHPQVVLIVLCIVLGLVGGVLTIKLEKPVLITATSLVGAAILVWGIGYFAGDFPSTSDLKEYATKDINGDWVYSIPDAWWGYLAGILVLFVLGLFIQFRKTGRGGVYHKSHAMGQRPETVQYVEAGTPQQENIRYGNPAANDTVSHIDDSIFDSTDEINLGASIVAVVSVIVGGGMVVYGYRFMYETVFAIGFALGAVGIAVTTERMLVDKSFWSIGSWLAFIFGGALCGGMALWVHPKSNFIAGVAGGIALAVMVTNSAAYYIFPGQTQEVFTLFCVVFSVIFAAVALKHGKPAEIVGISIFGATNLVWGVGFFVGDFPYPNNLKKYATQSANGDLVYSIPTVWWGYLGGIVVIAAFGMFMQFNKTGRTAVDDEFAGFGANGFGYPIDAVYVESEKQRPTIPVMEPVASTARDVESLISRAQGVQLGGSIMAATAMIVGAVMLTFGFRLIRAALFVVGFIAGGIAIAMITELTWLYPLSTFVAGAATGIMTAMILTNTFGYMIYPGHTKDLLTLMCVVLGILFGVLALKVGKPVLIISTSLFGSGMVVWSVGYFAGDFPNPSDLEQYASEDIDGETVYTIPAAWWGYLAGIIVFFVLGMYIQFRKTARNVKDKRPEGFGKRVDVAEYIEKKTARNQNQDNPDMEAPPRRQYVDLDATDEIIEYKERIPRQKRIIYSERESDVYEFESYREPCRICGDYVHHDSSCCSEKIVRIERH